MKKAIGVGIALILIILGVWLGGAYYFGVQGEHFFTGAIQDASTATNFNVVNEGYHRGVLVSHARTPVEIKIPSQTGENKQEAAENPNANSVVRFVLVHDVYHGPFPLTSKLYKAKYWPKPVMAVIETRIEIDPETYEPLKLAFQKIPELSGAKNSTVVTLGSDGEAVFEIPPFTRDIQDSNSGESVNVAWKGLTGLFAFKPQQGVCTGSLHAPALDITAKDGVLAFGGMESSVDMHRGASGLFVGDSMCGIADIHFVNKAEAQPMEFSVANLRMKSAGKETGPDIDFSLILEMDHLLANGASWGPGGLELQLRKIDAASLVKLRSALQELQSKRSGISEDELLKTMGEQFTQLGPGLLKDSPELELKRMDLKTDKGDFSGTAKFGFEGLDPKDAGNIITLATSLYATAEVSIAETLFHGLLVNALNVADSTEAEVQATTDQKVNELLQEKILVREGQTLKAAAAYKGGVLTLNGVELPLLNLFQ